jgi:hypothetical protein
VFDQSSPSRFRIIGFDYAPGLIARALRLALTLLLVAIGLGCGIVICVFVAGLCLYLLGLFAGAPELPRVLGQASRSEAP